MPLVRIETAPIAAATIADATTATSRWIQPLPMP
jgi:hypothetical protein